jgi:hypothetical protein
MIVSGNSGQQFTNQIIDYLGLQLGDARKQSWISRLLQLPGTEIMI